MTPENFCYFLKGYFELYGPKTLDEKETRVVWDHLNLVFNKVTPDRSGITLHSPKTPILGLDPNFEYTVDGQKIQRQSYTIPFNLLSENLDQSTISPSQISITC